MSQISENDVLETQKGLDDYVAHFCSCLPRPLFTPILSVHLTGEETEAQCSLLFSLVRVLWSTSALALISKRRISSGQVFV